MGVLVRKAKFKTEGADLESCFHSLLFGLLVQKPGTLPPRQISNERSSTSRGIQTGTIRFWKMIVIKTLRNVKKKKKTLIPSGSILKKLPNS